jgi:ATP-dependent DNA ligase
VEFPQILEALQKLSHKDVVLDGEIVAVEPSGRPNFNALQNRRSTKVPIYYIAFDCLHFGERDLLDTAIEERKRVLAKVTEDFLVSWAHGRKRASFVCAGHNHQG